jgi:PAS domain S-box-containing protein
VDHSTVFFFEAKDQSGIVEAEYPGQRILGQEIPVKGFPALRRILTTHVPLFVEDAQHSELMIPIRELLQSLDIRSTLLVPMQSKGTIVGLLTLDTIGRERTFTAQEIDMCETIVAQVAVAVENAQLFESMNTQANMLVRMTRDINAERSKLNAVLHNLVDGLLVTDTTGRVLIVNPSFMTMFRLGHRDYAQQYVSEVVPQLPLQHLILQTCYDKQVRTHEFALDDGRTLQCTAAVMHQDNEVGGVVVVLRDVTRTKQLDQLRSAFISNVSHELRTPLTIIDGFARRIDRSFKKTIVPLLPAGENRDIERIVRNIGYLLSGVQRLKDQVEDVLIIADIDAGRFEWHIKEVDIGPVFLQVAETYRVQAEAKQLHMHVDIPDNLPKIKGDAERLVLVLENLASNAVKFTESGEIAIHVQAIYRQGKQWEPLPPVAVPDLLIQDAYILTVVKDTGSGIPLNEQRVIFERFRQGTGDMLTDKPSGTGLGLAICREIVSFHGGHIWVDSEPGEKSAFAFVIPLVSSQSKLSDEAELEHQHAPTVLVADDEEPMRELLHYILSWAGYQTIMATDGPSALNMARMHKPDLILLDVMMPGISGLDVTSVIKNDEQLKDTPVVILSIVADPDRAVELGADACLAKPVEHDLLLSTLAELLRAQHTQVESSS